MIEKSAWYEKLEAELDQDPKYWVESMRFDFVQEVERLMQERGISRAELARRLGASPAYVTQMLKALFNPTLLTLAKVALALGARVKLELVPEQEPAGTKPMRPVPARRRSPAPRRPEFIASDKPRKQR